MNTTVYIGLGANLGNARHTLELALTTLNQLPRTTLLQASSLYRTAPVQATGPDYINAVAKIRTALSAHELLRQLQHVEQEYGRSRSYVNAPRTLDLDILLFGTTTVNDRDLIIPHPRMHERAFVLVPLAELDPELTLAQGRLQELITHNSDQHIEKLSGEHPANP